MICRTATAYPQPEQRRWLEQLPNHPNLRLISGTLSNEDFERLLLQADALLIPYRKQAFSGRTSGIYADAIQLGKPVITTHETWMGRWTKRLGNGLTFADGNSKDLAETMKEMARRLPELRNQSTEARTGWSRKNGIVSFFDFLIAGKFSENGEPLPENFLQEIKRGIARSRPRGVAYFRNRLGRSAYLGPLIQRWKQRK